jgi:hypothetical protein
MFKSIFLLLFFLIVLLPLPPLADDSENVENKIVVNYFRHVVRGIYNWEKGEFQWESNSLKSVSR